jgi:hypothetical protein
MVELFSLPLLQAVSDWQRGGDPKQNKRRGQTLKAACVSLSDKYRSCHLVCFRQIGLPKGGVWDLIGEDCLPEKISSWTTDLEVAKAFKGGVPPKGQGYQGVILCMMPNPNDVIVNLGTLYRDAEFLEALERKKASITGYYDGAGRYGNDQSEVVLEIHTVTQQDVHSLGGHSSTFDRLVDEAADLFYGRKATTTERLKLMLDGGKARSKVGPNWLSESATRHVLTRVEPAANALVEAKRQKEAHVVQNEETPEERKKNHLPLLIDKNILQGWSQHRLDVLASEFKFVMPDVLFFEMLSADAKSRAKCFGALPATDNPITLVDHIGEHMRYELDQGKRLGKPSEHPISWTFRFHPRLRDIDYIIPSDVQKKIDEENVALRERVKNFIARARTIEPLIEDLVNQGLTRPQAFEQLRKDVLDLQTFRTNLPFIAPPPEEAMLENSALQDDLSAVVRHAQLLFLFAIDAWGRYKQHFQSGAALSEKLYRKLEHDVLDLEYLSLAVLEGSFATQEEKLRLLFKALRPDGVLIPEESQRKCAAR